MRGLITYIVILGFVSPYLCLSRNVETQNDLFNVMQYGACGDGKSDDSQAFLKAWNSACGAEGITTLVIPPEKSFMVTQLVLDGKACQAKSINIQLQGEIVAPSKDEWKAGQYWITIQHVNGLTIDGNGGIDGDGSTWWQCESCQRPVALFFLACNDLTVKNLRITNTPKAHISITGCKVATFSNININSPPDSPNTDGFDISDSNNILIEDSNIKAGDDCIAINGGSSYINVTRVACGPGHGISVGSLGRSQTQDTVEDVYVTNCSFIETTNGARIKTVSGGSGYAKRITFEQIQLINVKNPIIINQNYNAGGSGYAKRITFEQIRLINVKNPIIANQNYNADDSAVQVSEVTYRGFNGTSASDIAINLDCCSSGCFGIELDQINIVSSQSEKQTSAFCQNVHGIVKSTIPIVSCMTSEL